ncbi:MAG: response regulator [Planctomycetaceae bacterium]
MNILLVEDNPVDKMFVTQSLQQVDGFDYQLTCTGSLSEALEKLDASTFDVVLLDLWLPDSEGLETCHRVVAANRDIPVVVMTGIDDRTLAKEAIRAGAQDYLVKGAYPGSAVARVLQYAIDRHQFQREVVERENHFNQVLSHVPAIIWTTDPELKINSVAGAEVQVLNRNPQHAVGLTLEECFHITDKSDEVFKAHQSALKENPQRSRLCGREGILKLGWILASIQNRPSSGPLVSRWMSRTGD